MRGNRLEKTGDSASVGDQRGGVGVGQWRVREETKEKEASKVTPRFKRTKFIYQRETKFILKRVLFLIRNTNEKNLEKLKYSL